jgi:hypothetical protein
MAIFLKHETGDRVTCRLRASHASSKLRGSPELAFLPVRPIRHGILRPQPDAQPHPYVRRSAFPRLSRCPDSRFPLRNRWTDEDIEVASAAAIHFVKAFYKSMDNVVERLPVRPKL